MTKINDHNQLLQEWKKQRPHYSLFINDGILSMKDFEIQNPKILFLLKESNADFINISPINENSKGYGPQGNSNTFWRYMRGYEYVLQCFWRNINFNWEEAIRVKELPNINTAYVNIKKQCENKSKSNNNEIIKYAKEDKDFLVKQINIIDPDIIYCAGTFNSYRYLTSDIIEIKKGVYKTGNRIIVDFYHLAHRKGYSTFSELFELLKGVTLGEAVKS